MFLPYSQTLDPGPDSSLKDDEGLRDDLSYSEINIVTTRWGISRNATGLLGTIKGFGGDLRHSRSVILTFHSLFYDFFLNNLYK